MSTINNILIKRRLSTSQLNSIPTLSGGELAFSEKNSTLYYGAEIGTLEIGGDGAFVNRTNAQSISGNKTFVGSTTLSALTFSPNSIFDAGSNVLTNLGTPLNDADATTKLYVDTVASGASSSTNALSSHIDTFFVEKIESDAVTLNGGLTVTNEFTTDTFTATGNASVSGNLTVQGDFRVLGELTTLETSTSITSAFNITNDGTTTALVVNQSGSTDIAEFKDDNATALIIKDGGNVGVGTATPNEKLTVFGNLSASGNIYGVNGNFTGTLNVGGSTTFSSNISGIGNVSLINFTIDGGSF